MKSEDVLKEDYFYFLQLVEFYFGDIINLISNVITRWSSSNYWGKFSNQWTTTSSVYLFKYSSNQRSLMISQKKIGLIFFNFWILFWWLYQFDFKCNTRWSSSNWGKFSNRWTAKSHVYLLAHHTNKVWRYLQRRLV